MKNRILIIIMMLSFLSLLTAQSSLDETLEDLSGAAAESYVGPIVSAFGASLNSGWFHKVPKAKLFNLDIELGLVYMGSFFGKGDETFNVDGSFRFTESQARDIVRNSEEVILDNLEQDEPEVFEALVEALVMEVYELNIHGPTIIGPEDENIFVEFPDNQPLHVNVNGIDFDYILDARSIELPVGGQLENLSHMPMIAPQLGIGTIYGTKLYTRYMTLDLTSIGKYEYFGIGIQHNPKVYIPFPIPVDFSASFFMQDLKLGEYVSAKATVYGINVSRTIGPGFLNVTPYAGLMFESSKMKFKYEYQVSGQEIDVEPVAIEFEAEGENNAKLTLGTAMNWGIYSMNADFNIAKYNSFSFGFGFEF